MSGVGIFPAHWAAQQRCMQSDKDISDRQGIAHKFHKRHVFRLAQVNQVKFITTLSPSVQPQDGFLGGVQLSLHAQH